MRKNRNVHVINIKLETKIIKAKTRKTKWKVEYGGPIVIDMTGGKFFDYWSKDPGFIKMYEEYIKNERKQKLERILNK